MNKYLALTGLMLAGQIMTSCSEKKHGLICLSRNTVQSNEFYVATDDHKILVVTQHSEFGPPNATNGSIEYRGGKNKDGRDRDTLSITQHVDVDGSDEIICYKGYLETLDLISAKESPQTFRATIKEVKELPRTSGLVYPLMPLLK